jgi:hypothetical protein
MLVHGEEVEGVLYKYDLPLENTPMKLKNELLVIDEAE